MAVGAQLADGYVVAADGREEPLGTRRAVAKRRVVKGPPAGRLDARHELALEARRGGVPRCGTLSEHDDIYAEMMFCGTEPVKTAVLIVRGPR